MPPKSQKNSSVKANSSNANDSRTLPKMPTRSNAPQASAELPSLIENVRIQASALRHEFTPGSKRPLDSLPSQQPVSPKDPDQVNPIEIGNNAAVSSASAPNIRLKSAREPKSSGDQFLPPAPSPSNHADKSFRGVSNLRTGPSSASPPSGSHGRPKSSPRPNAAPS